MWEMERKGGRMERWKDKNGIYGWIQICLPESHCHDVMVLLRVILWILCITVVIKMPLTLLWITKIYRTSQNLENISLPNPLHSSHNIAHNIYCCWCTGSLRTRHVRPVPCAWRGFPITIATSCHLSTLRKKSQGYGLFCPADYFIFLHLIHFWNHVIILLIFCSSLDFMTH